MAASGPWERLQKGWSREELVRQIALSMKAHGEAYTGLTADTARRWESGERWPEARFRKHLVLLFGLPASDLGLLTPEELEHRPAGEVVGNDALVGLVGAGIRRLLMADELDGLGRQQFLRALLAAGLTPFLASTVVGEPTPPGTQQTRPETPSRSRRIARSLRPSVSCIGSRQQIRCWTPPWVICGWEFACSLHRQRQFDMTMRWQLASPRRRSWPLGWRSSIWVVRTLPSAVSITPNQLCRSRATMRSPPRSRRITPSFRGSPAIR